MNPTKRVPVVVAQSYFARMIGAVNEAVPAGEQKVSEPKPKTITPRPERKFRKKASEHHKLSPIEERALIDPEFAREVKRGEWD